MVLTIFGWSVVSCSQDDLIDIWISVSQHPDNRDGEEQCTSSEKARDIEQLGDVGL